ncbi:hypothetical protein [Oceanirhabdus sp. W0125-5]|uniref:hypothetical protein n=1 Tax=Oceanirhabdus sp. W0125-5 TaxID=2999116 RepID=UPI0022F2EE44|nr:hypothetical protein [Oceanirhabdus sp. W0125-5]WBW98840.1 hypothetical protein OW730_08890 [Oceanirhabdus sp. W0125-5]
MVDEILKAKKIFSFNPQTTGGKYAFVELDKELTDKFCNCLSMVNENEDYFIVFRGDQKEKKFICEDLNDYFVVGQKSSFFYHSVCRNVYNENFKDSNSLKLEIKQNIIEINKIIKKKKIKTT